MLSTSSTIQEFVRTISGTQVDESLTYRIGSLTYVVSLFYKTNTNNLHAVRATLTSDHKVISLLVYDSYGKCIKVLRRDELIETMSLLTISSIDDTLSKIYLEKYQVA